MVATRASSGRHRRCGTAARCAVSRSMVCLRGERGDERPAVLTSSQQRQHRRGAHAPLTCPRYSRATGFTRAGSGQPVSARYDELMTVANGCPPPCCERRRRLGARWTGRCTARTSSPPTASPIGCARPASEQVTAPRRPHPPLEVALSMVTSEDINVAWTDIPPSAAHVCWPGVLSGQPGGSPRFQVGRRIVVVALGTTTDVRPLGYILAIPVGLDEGGDAHHPPPACQGNG